LLYSEWRSWRGARAAFKVTASTAFVLVALAAGARESGYGQMLLVAFCWSWLGDVLLLSARAPFFLAGLGAFLVAHVCFTIAFLAGDFAPDVLGLASIPAAIAGIAIARWLWSYLSAAFKTPVLVYIATILFMCAAAAGYAAASGVWGALLGAILFAASDIAVARDRFVHKSIANKAWGWPVYYLAQLTLAWSVAAAR
jgi:uncharacterized membrane protein YhhN